MPVLWDRNPCSLHQRLTVQDRDVYVATGYFRNVIREMLMARAFETTEINSCAVEYGIRLGITLNFPIALTSHPLLLLYRA